MKVLFEEVKEEFHTQDAKIDAKIEALINLQKERLEFNKQMQKQQGSQYVASCRAVPFFCWEMNAIYIN